MSVLIGVLWIAGGLGAVHLMMRWMEDRGWIYYRRKRGHPMGVAASNALLHFEAIVNPAVEHVIEEMDRQDAEVPTSVAPPRPDDAED